MNGLVPGQMQLSGRGVICVRGGREVFSGLDFEAVSGEAVAVTGRNGSGKTSLLRLIAGLLVPAEGTIELQGGDAELSLPEQCHYLGHRDALKPALSVAENLSFWADFLGGERCDAAESLAILLRLEGHDVELAHDGVDALRRFAARRPDIALLDIGMPNVNGFEVARQIRATPEGQGVLLIAITGWAQDSDRAQSRAAGFDHHLTKPIEPEVLIGLLGPQ